MSDTNSFQKVLEKYRAFSFSEQDKGARFERLMQAYLQTDPKYAFQLEKVWLWNEFPFKAEFGGKDTGIDIVALTSDGEYWAIQCKCYQESAVIDKPSIDSFISTSSREFKNEDSKKVSFSQRLWISTTNNWGENAEESIRNQSPPFTRINLYDLNTAPVSWSDLEKGIHGEKSRINDRELKPHQKEALDKAHEYFKTADRGKLIMACGTGKTFNSLRIAENETDNKGLILFLVPSIALLGQTLREWTTFANEPINPICICSDAEISKKKTKNDDNDSFSVVDLSLPASTDVNGIVKQFKRIKSNQSPGMTVVFSTYQSIDVIAEAQKKLIKSEGFGVFDLIICDEAHRTTGVTLADEEESAFTKVHYNENIKGKKRLYMTATPRLYNDDAKGKAAQLDAVLCSMDDKKIYGEEIYRIGFGEAVDKKLLTDYKVLILTLSDKEIPPAIQKMITDKNSEITANDASKLIGCINALSKQILGDEGIIKETDPLPMKRAVAFCQQITVSKKITSAFNTATVAYVNSLPEDKKDEMVSLSSKHIDGTMAAPKRDELLGWLKEDTAKNECRVLTNVRCLSEGVDVPSLDAILFLSARSSQVDVVQSVGRVMRLAPNKKFGYIIIPVIVPSDIDADKALDDNENYKVVWSVLNALRAHDDRFDATVNQIDVNKKRPKQIIVGTPQTSFKDGKPVSRIKGKGDKSDISTQIALQFEKLQEVVFARMVTKVGDKRYWENWAKDVAQIAERQVERINRLITEDTKHKKEFANFLGGLQKNINPSITQQQAVEMLSQHIITKPVFEALFDGYSFVKKNPISVSMQTMLNMLEDQSFQKDAEILNKFYESVKMRACGIDNSEGKQRIIIELYDKFFKTAFPKMVEQLGIVYTPVECVDFIIHSVNDVLKKEFSRSVSDENVHILDPFTGTGTFITRLLQSGLIKEKDLERKYKHELHANEIVLLAYYIAAINIENAYHVATPDPDDGIGTEKYTPFDGIVLTDTFQLGEKDANEKIFSDMFPQNSARVAKQMKAPLMVIMGNPPYSVGQSAANDNAQNQTYPKLESRILTTYAESAKGTGKKSLYDSYIKAFRWSTDRLDKNGGIICFVSNGAWLDGNGTTGFRKSIEKEFTSIYVFNLRGNARTTGELNKKEGHPLFGATGGRGGSKTPISITLLVKKPKEDNNKVEKASIFYRNIGDYLKRDQKLKIVKEFHSFGNEKMEFEMLLPNDQGDWISKRNDSFESYIPIGDKSKNSSPSIFGKCYSCGILSGRDSWVWNFNNNILKENISKTIEFYNSERNRFQNEYKKNQNLKFENFINYDSLRITWDARKLKNGVLSNKEIKLINKDFRIGMYRPYTKQYIYSNPDLIWSLFQFRTFLPNSDFENRIICLSPSLNDGLSLLITNSIVDLHLNGDTQSFPLYYYEENNRTQKGLFDADESQKYVRRDAISDFILERAIQQYGKTITKEDIFYYVYGFLHSKEYRETFANDLKKMLPRLPLVETVTDFWAFSKAGRKLAELHINYESVDAYKGVKVTGDDGKFYDVVKMNFPKKSQKVALHPKETIYYNSKITISNIPEKAYEYVVNGKSAIDWIMERYQVTTHKESGIKNDPNDWAKEVGNPRYILDLLLSIINVSMQTVEIVEGLPKVKFE